MKFGLINMWRNAVDHPLPRWVGDTQITLFPAGNKAHRVTFFGAPERGRLLRFLKANAATPLAVEVPPITRAKTLREMDGPPAPPRPHFAPARAGDAARQWAVVRPLEVSSRYAYFFLVTDAAAPPHIMKCISIRDPSLDTCFASEVAVHRSLARGPPLFPRIIHDFRAPDPALGSVGCFVMTYAARGNVLQLVEDGMDDLARRRIARGMAQALAAFHALGFIHDDIRISNFVVTDAGVVQLIDFQSSWPLAHPPAQLHLWRNCAYDSPERAENAPRGPPSDAWALGVALWELWEEVGSVPNFLQIVSDGARIPFTVATPPDIRDLICRLLVLDPEKRLTVQQVVDLVKPEDEGQ
jgi:serine/threonine protein kinase